MKNVSYQQEGVVMQTLTTHPFTMQALASPLHPTMPVDKAWFTELTALYTEQNKPVPQVIDNLFFDGQDMVVLWVPHSARAADKSPQKTGWHISCIQYHFVDSGEEVSYLKAIYATSESIASAGDKNDAKIISPVIDFAKVHDAFRGQGIAPSMYVYLARKLAEQDMTLRESGCQSEEAGAMWQRMKHDPLLPIFVINDKYVLDFRSNSNTGGYLP